MNITKTLYIEPEATFNRLLTFSAKFDISAATYQLVVRKENSPDLPDLFASDDMSPDSTTETDGVWTSQLVWTMDIAELRAAFGTGCYYWLKRTVGDIVDVVQEGTIDFSNDADDVTIVDEREVVSVTYEGGGGPGGGITTEELDAAIATRQPLDGDLTALAAGTVPGFITTAISTAISAAAGNYQPASGNLNTLAANGVTSGISSAISSAVAGKASTTYVDSGDAATLATAESYTDSAVSGLVNATFVSSAISTAIAALSSVYQPLATHLSTLAAGTVPGFISSAISSAIAALSSVYQPLASNLTALAGGAITNGVTATKQTLGDNTDKVATDSFVHDAVAGLASSSSVTAAISTAESYTDTAVANMAKTNNANSWTASQTPNANNAIDLGSTSKWWRNLFIGAATYYAKLQTGTLTANRTVTIPDADSVTVRPSTGSAGQYVNGLDSDGALTYGTPSGGSVDPRTNDFRLSLASGVYNDSASGVTGATRIYWTPPQAAGGTGKVKTRDAGTWTEHQSSEIYLDFPANPCQQQDIYVNYNGSALVLSAQAADSTGRVSGTITDATAAAPCVLTSNNTLSVGDFIMITGITGSMGSDSSAQGLGDRMCRVSARTSTTITLEGMDTTGLTYTSGGTWYKIPTTPAVAPVQQDNVWCKTGALDYRWVGRIRTRGDGTICVVSGRMLVDNVDNAINIPASCKDTASNWTLPASTNTCRLTNLNSLPGAGRIEFVQCFASNRNFRDFGTAIGFAGAYNYEIGLLLNKCAVTLPLRDNTNVPISAGAGRASGGNGEITMQINEANASIPAGSGWIQRMETNGFSGAATSPYGSQSSGGAYNFSNGLVGTLSH
ncbi:MAG: hypothetical protein EKK48_12315 [Candidatus Melainabacteria bacterium]|nr:MAG: hypothetical protein EKK48_12315 [Candidatus Melainabacteria bacterium]